MKQFIILTLAFITFTTYSQDKNNYIRFNNLTEVVGTEYVIAFVQNRGKGISAISEHLLFINTNTGDTNRINFSEGANIGKPEQVKIDNLGINLIIISGRTIDLDEKSGITWNDPKQIIVISPDGKEKTQLTDDKFFVSTYTVNKKTGTIVISGHNDTNGNNKYDKTDKSEIYIYDLKTLKLKSKI